MSDLISIEDLEIYLKTDISDGSPSTTTADEALYGFLITAVSEQAELVCGRTFAETSYSIKVDGNNSNDLILENPPIISLTSAKYTDVLDNTSDIDLNFVEIDYDEGMLYKNSIWVKGRKNILISYSAGFSIIPDALKLVICKFVVEAFKGVNTREGITKEKLGDRSYELAGNLAKNEQFINELSPWILQDIF